MNTRSRKVLVFFAMALVMPACAQIMGWDQEYLRESNGGSGGGTGLGGHGGMGGMGGGPACDMLSDCPGVDDTCQQRTCTMGVCGVDYKPVDTQIPMQTAGDCKLRVCDGNGAQIDNNDDTDVPDDSNACTDDVCTAGVPSNPNLMQGTDCTPQGATDPLVCNDMGQCVDCNTGADCPGTDDECRTRTCTAGVCGVSFTAADTPVMAQTDNNCLMQVCDGNGQFVDIADDADLPLDDGNPCTGETCSMGAPNHPDLADGSACNDGDLCTPMDTCQMGVCTAGMAITCTPSDQCHVAGTCDPMTGMCSNPNASNGVPCQIDGASGTCAMGACKKDTGQPCTAAGECSSGSCADGVCCNSACITTCQACSIAAGAAVNGTCGNIVENTEDNFPQNACSVDTTGINTCSNGACNNRSWAAWHMPNPSSAMLPNPSSYTINPMNGTVTDDVTDLMWQRTIDAASYTWANAKTYCANLVYGGYSDWRLPTRIELVSLVDFTKPSPGPTIDTTAFPNTPGTVFWTSSPFAGSPSSAWDVYFDGGYTLSSVVTGASRVRCVR